MTLPLEFWFGLAGGVFAEILGLWKMRQVAPQELPHYLKSAFYWLMTLAMIAVGGIVAFVYVKSGIALSPLLAVNVGASAPLIIGSLTASPPNVTKVP